jgi:peptidoglycan hydrolase-like protein with peptidoglycan-binding domain
MEKNETYSELVQPKGLEYRESQLDLAHTHYKDPIDTSNGRLAGNSHVWGDASPEVQSRQIDALIEASQRRGLNTRETGYVLEIARAESGFNPDAAAGTTSAYGLGQFTDGTGRGVGITPANAGDMTRQAESLVQLYKENAALAASKGQGEEYIYKYHHDGPQHDYGGLALSRDHVMPEVHKMEAFVAAYEKKYDVLPADPNFHSRNMPVTDRTHAHAAAHHGGGSLRHGSRGDAVGELQAHLNELGYTDANNKPMRVDKDFGQTTETAVKAFQRDHGLDDDGKVGPTTAKAINDAIADRAKAHGQPAPGQAPAVQAPARLDDPKHPDNAMFLQAREHVFRFDQQAGKTPDQGSENLAASLVVSARLNGLSRVDVAAFNGDASKLWAAERPPGMKDNFFDKHANVDTVQGINTSMQESGAQWPQAMQQFQQHQQAQGQQQQQPAQQQNQAQNQPQPHGAGVAR